MKKVMLLLLILGLGLAASSVFSANVNLCFNSGFEEGTGTAAAPWSLWGSAAYAPYIQGAQANPVPGANNTSPRVWGNFNNPTYTNVASQNYMSSVWLVPGVTYHYRAQYYIPASEVVAGTIPVTAIRLSMMTAGAPFVVDDSTAAGKISATNQWVTFEGDWVYPGTAVDQTNYLSFRLYGRKDLGGGVLGDRQNTPGGYFDNCEFWGPDTYYAKPNLTGYVKESGSGVGIAGAVVTVKDSANKVVATATTGADGKYTIPCPRVVTIGYSDTESFTVDAANFSFYLTDGYKAFVYNANPTVPDVTMTKQPSTTISGTVLGPSGPVAGATVSFLDVASGAKTTTTSGADGTYSKTMIASLIQVSAYKMPLATAAPVELYTFDGTGGGKDMPGTDLTMVALTPLIDVNASALPVGSMTSWANTGSVGGTFGADTVLTATPSVTMAGFRKAVYFNGSNALRLSVPAPTSISAANPWTVSAWLYCATTNTSSNRTYFSWAHRGTNFSSAEMRYADNYALAHFGADNGFGTVPAPATWHHIAVTYDGSTEVCYVDGVASTTVTGRTLTIFANDPVILGRGYTNADGTGSNYPWIGYMASLQMFDKALPAEYVANFATMPPPYAATHTITASADAGATITPSGAVAVMHDDSQTFTFAPKLGYAIASVSVDGVVQTPTPASYTFTHVVADHTISVTSSLLPTATISGKVVNANGAGIGGATVYFSGSSNASVTSFATATTAADGTFSKSGIPQGTIYVSAGAAGFWNSPDKAVALAGNTSGVYITLRSSARNIPAISDLMYGVLAESLPASGAITTWANIGPAGGTLASIETPTVDVVDNIKWVKNDRIGSSDGFRFGAAYTSPVAVNGVTIVAAVRPIYCNPGGELRGEVVDFFYGDLFLAVSHTDGQVMVCNRKYSVTNTGYFIQEGKKTILSLVVSPTGTMTLYANGAVVWGPFESGVDYTTLIPANTTSDLVNGYDRFMTIGRNNPDGWSAFNGNIGDVLVYAKALSDAERAQLEADLNAKFGLLPDVQPPAQKPVGVNNKSVLTDAKLAGKTVRVWGAVKQINAGSYIIDDGYGAGVTVKGTTTLSVGQMAVVTGVVQADKSIQP